MDIYVVQLQDEIPLTSIQNVPATLTVGRKLLLYGRSFDFVREVEINGYPVTTGFDTLQPGILSVTLPTILQNVEIKSIRAYSDRVHDTKSSRLVFRFGYGDRVTGLQAMIQLLIKWLFTSPGSDAWHPHAGGGWRKLSGFTDDQGDGTSILPLLVDGLNRTVSFLQQLQAQNPDLPMEERLASALLDHTTKTQFGIRVGVRVKAVSDDSALVSVRL